jgi:hypothetical protein
MTLDVVSVVGFPTYRTRSRDTELFASYPVVEDASIDLGLGGTGHTEIREHVENTEVKTFQ